MILFAELRRFSSLVLFRVSLFIKPALGKREVVNVSPLILDASNRCFKYSDVEAFSRKGFITTE